MVRVPIFHNDGSQGIIYKEGKKTRVLLCTFMLPVNGKGEFFRVEKFL